MNALDRLLSYFAPRYALRRSFARAALRSYDGAGYGRRRHGFGGARGGSANVAVGARLALLRDRARDLVRNTPHGHALVDTMVRHVVGTGITPVWNTGSDRLDRQVGALWDEWCARAGAEGEHDFYADQALAVRAMIEGGEALVRFVDLPRAEDARVPLRVQLLEGDCIDSSRDGTIGGRRVRLGVALGPWNRREGYFLFTDHPGESLASLSSAFVDRDLVRHLYRPLRIGQLRGVTWLAPVLLAANDLHELMQATIVKAAIEASFAGFIINEAGAPSPLPEKVNAQTGEREMLPEPGMMVELKAGQDIKFAAPPGSTQFEAVAVHTLQAMAIGIGCTYDQATGDLRQANYSSLRAGKIEFRRLIEQIQWHVVVPRLCEPVAERFIARAVLAGTLRARAEGYPRDWVPPANEPIDPKKDLEADILAVRAGRLSPQEFIGQWGRDWRRVIAASADFWAAADALALELDIDGRRPPRARAETAEERT